MTMPFRLNRPAVSAVVIVVLITTSSSQVVPRTAEAVSPPVTSTPDGSCSFCVLEPSDTSLTLNGNANLTLPRGNVMVNSSSNAAVTLTGNAVISAPSVGVVGGVSTSGKAVAQNLTTGAGPVTDPLLGAQTPAIARPRSPTKVTLSDTAQRALFPGVYDAISVTGRGSLTLNAGTYVILHDFSVSGGGTVSGRGVTIYLACASYPSPCSTGQQGGSLELTGKGRFELTAPSGICSAGQMAVQADPNNTSTIALTGNASDTLTGSVYAPSGTLVAAGEGRFAIGGQVVVSRAILTGNGKIALTAGGSLISSPTLSLSPTSAGPDKLGTPQALTATLVDGSGHPVANELIGLSVSGANTIATSEVTNSSGQATLSYVGVRGGTDTAKAFFGNGDRCINSNTATVTWTAHPAPIAMGPVQGNFYAEPGTAQSFTATTSDAPLFAQQFPVVDFNPPAGIVPGNASGVGPNTRPFTDVTTNLAGGFTGTMVAQGNGVQAGVGQASTFDAVLTSTFVVSSPGNVTFGVIADDGFILGVGNGATAVSGPSKNPPASGLTPFLAYPVMASWNAIDTGPPASYSVTVSFPSPGTYPFELDYFSRSTQLSLVLTVVANSAQQPPLAIFTGYADTVRSPGSSTFPFPWQGTNGLTFVGSPNADGTWDSGALRFDNTTSSPITLDHVTVDIGSNHFDPGWTKVVVPANSTAILTGSGQLTSGLPTGRGGIYITGHDPDYHGYLGLNKTGAQDILQRAVGWVTFGKTSPKMLLVTDLNNPGGDQSDPRLGLTAAGFTYDVADDGSSGQVLDVHKVDFTKYGVIVVASDYGGWLRQSELDLLNGRSTDLIAFVNAGGGLVALAECGCRGNGTGTTHNRYGYLPTIVSSAALNQSEFGYTLTTTGTSMGLAGSDINGNASHAIFTSTGGLTPVDHDPAGHIISLTERGLQVGQSNFDTSDAGQNSPPPSTGTCCIASNFATGFPTNGSVGPIGLAFDRAGNFYVGDYVSGTVIKLAPQGGSAGNAIWVSPTLGGNVLGVGFSKSGRLYAMVQNPNQLVELDPATGHMLRVVTTFGGGYDAVAADPLSGDIFVTSAGGGPMLRISGFESSSPPVVTNYASGGQDGMVFAPDGTIYAAQYLVGVIKIAGTDQPQPASVTSIASIPLSDGIAFLEPPPGQPVTKLVVNRNDGVMTEVDTSTTPPTLTNVITGGTRGDFVTVGADGCLYATQSTLVEKVTFSDGSCPFVPTTPVCPTSIPTPQIHVTTGGQTTSYADSTKALAAGGHDAECGQPPSNLNESEPWIQLNQGAPAINVPMPPTLTLAISPASLPSTVVGKPLSLAVTALDSSGQAVSQLAVKLGVTGANPQQLTATTDAAGAASFSYIGTAAGTDAITATAFQNGALQPSNTVSTIWTIPLPAPAPTASGQSAPVIFNLSPADQTTVSAAVPVSATVLAPSGFAVTQWSVTSQLLPSGSVVTLASGSGPPPATLATFDPAGRPAGTYAVSVSASSTGGGSSTAVTRLIIAGSGPGGGAGGSAAQAPPSITQPSPPDGTIVYSPVPIQATITLPSGHAIASWSVTAAAQAGGAPITIATGSGTPPTPMTTLDPTLLANDTYTITISATTDAGATQMLLSSVVVAGNLKLGRAVSSYRDLVVPVNGVQMEVNRVYDSTDTRSGDFGFGWHLDLTNFRVSVNRPLGAGGWTEYQTSCFIICNWAFKSGAPHYATVTYPDGHQEAFDLTPLNTGLTLIDFASTTAAFTGRPGVTSTLAVANASDQTVTNGFDGNLYGAAGTIYNPTQFILTTRDGRALTLDTSRGLVSEKGASGNTLTVDSSGVHSSTGSSLMFARDSSGRITDITGPSGEHLTYAYSAAGDLASYTNAIRGVSSFTYDSAHNLLHADAASGSKPSFTNTYDARGRLIAITDASGATLQITDDVGAKTQTLVDANGALVTVDSFDSLGDLVNESELFGGSSQSFTYSYDSLGHMLSWTDALGATWGIAYDSTGDVLATTDPLQNTTKFAYDAGGHVMSETRPDGTVATTMTYDSHGHLTGVVGSDGARMSYTWDNAGRMISASSNRSGSMTMGYDASGNLTQVTNAAGTNTTMTYDASGRLTSTSGPLGISVGTQYDAFGDVTRITDAASHARTFTYDSFGRLVAGTDSTRNTGTLTYDAVGRIASIKDAAGIVTSYSYDADGHVLTRSAGATTEQFTYDALGRTISAVNDAATVKLTYDADSRVTGQTESGPSIPSTTISNAYDPAGNLVRVTAPQGTIMRTYDSDGRLTGIRDSFGNTTLTYDTGSRLTSLSRASGAVDQLTYDSTGRLASRTTSVGSTAIDSISYSYSALGAVSAITHGGDTVTFTRDAAGRVTGVSHSDPTATPETFAYDAENNRTAWSGAPGAYSYDQNDQLLSSPSATFTYDALGQRTGMTTTGGTTTYTWSPSHQLAQVTTPGGSSTSYKYDALGHRVAVRDGTTTRAFVYDGDQVVAEFDNGTQGDGFTPGVSVDRPLSMQRGGQVYYYLQDQHGNVTGLLAGSGGLAQTYSYSAFGNPGSSSGSLSNPFTWNGLQYDSSSQSYYSRARYYDPQNGVFLSRDPLLAMNPYSYGGGDPADVSDASGMQAEAEYGTIFQFDWSLSNVAFQCITGAIGSAFTSMLVSVIRQSSVDVGGTVRDAGISCAVSAFFPSMGRSLGADPTDAALFSWLRGFMAYVGFSALIAFMLGFFVDIVDQISCGAFDPHSMKSWGHAIVAGLFSIPGGIAGGIAGSWGANMGLGSNAALSVLPIGVGGEFSSIWGVASPICP